MTTALLVRLAALAATAAGGDAPAPSSEVLADRPDGTVVRSGRTVAKAHAPDADPRELTARLRIAAHPLLHGILLPPLPLTAPDGFLTLAEEGRALTRWPYGSPVPPDDPDAAPWEDAARLLARLHCVGLRQLPGPVPPMRGPAKAARALARLRTARDSAAGPPPGSRAPRTAAGVLSAAAAAVERAWALLPRGPGTRPRRRAPALSATAICTWASWSATPPETAPGSSSTSTTWAGATAPGTWPAPPPGSPPACWRRTSGRASWPPTARPAGPPWGLTVIPGRTWRFRPARSPCRPPRSP